MRQNKVKMICEAGLYSAMYATFILICRASSGLLESLLFFIMPLPTIFFAIRYNIKQSFLMVLATFIVCFLFSPLSTIFYVLPSCLMGIFYAYFKKKNASELIQILTAIVTSFIVNISTMFIFADLFDYSIYDDFGTTINGLLKFIDLLFNSKLASNSVIFYIDLLAPSIILVLALIEGYLMHMISSIVIEKMKVNQRKILPFFLFQLPIYLGVISFVFVLLGGYIFISVKSSQNSFFDLARFILPLAFLGYILLFVQGIARIACVLLSKKRANIFPIVLILALLLNILVIILGFFALFNDKRDDLLYNVKWKGDA